MSATLDSPAKIMATYSAIACFIVFAFIPVAMMVIHAFMVDSFLSLANFHSLIADSRQALLLLRSLLLAVGATVAALAMGVPMAFYIHRGRTKGQKWVGYLYLLPLTIPPQVFATVWISLSVKIQPITGTGPAPPWVETLISLFSAAALLAMAYYPLIVLTTLAGLKALDRRLEEAASLVKGPTVVWRTITLPLLGPYIATGAVFVFLFCLFNYGVPALLNLQTYPVEIFAQFSAFYNEGRAAALACPLIITALVLLWLIQKKMRNRSYFTISSGSTPDNVEPMGKIDILLSITAWSVITLSVFVPLVTLLIQTASWQVLAVVMKTSFHELTATLSLSAAAAVAMVLIAYPLADAVSRVKSGIWQWLNLFTLLPFAIPATVLGIGIIYVWNRPYLDRIYSSAVILAIAFVARFLPFAVRAMAAGFSQIAPNLREAALIHERSDFRRWFNIERPLIQRSMAVSWLIGFILCMNELGATLLVIPPGYGTLSLKIYNLMHYGANQMVAGMALLLVLINLAVAGVVSKIFITKKVRRL